MLCSGVLYRTLRVNTHNARTHTRAHRSRTHFHKQILKQMRLRNELLYKVVEVPHRHTTRKQFTVTLKDTSKVRKYLAEIEEAAGGLDTDGMPRV